MSDLRPTGRGTESAAVRSDNVRLKVTDRYCSVDNCRLWLEVSAGSISSGCPTERHATCMGTAVPSFQIMRRLVTVGEYRRCVDAKACTPPVTSPLQCDSQRFIPRRLPRALWTGPSLEKPQVYSTTPLAGHSPAGGARAGRRGFSHIWRILDYSDR